jgi:hypothetical protein
MKVDGVGLTCPRVELCSLLHFFSYSPIIIHFHVAGMKVRDTTSLHVMGVATTAAGRKTAPHLATTIVTKSRVMSTADTEAKAAPGSRRSTGTEAIAESV